MSDTADEDVIEAASRRVDGLFGFDDFFPARVSSTNRISLGEWVLDWDEAITVDGYDNRYTVPYRSTEGAAPCGWWRRWWHHAGPALCGLVRRPDD